ncbi:MAG: hypothetical protein LBG19_05510 [Prevotellaceae bacterium]|jgi:hypothetical protein|nr:hypothetical protein [Prevotellaceae bacterium]
MIRLESDNSAPLYLSFQGCNGETRDTFTGGITINLMLDDVDAAYEQIKRSG